MELTRLVYFSRVAQGLTAEDAHAIAQVASTANSRNYITGALLYNHQYFVQVLEGARTSVSQVFGKIQKDPRHTQVIIVSVCTIYSRAFSAWSMRYIAVTEAMKPTLLRFGCSCEFRPDLMSDLSLFEFCKAAADLP